MESFGLDLKDALKGLKGWAGDIFRHTSDSLIDLILTILILVVIERRTGPSGLGIYSYFMSLYVMARYISGWGIARYVAVKLAGTEFRKSEADALLLMAERSVLLSSSICCVLFIFFALSGTVFTQVDESAAAYVIVGLAIVLYNYNHLRISSLSGWGRHELFVSMKFRRRIALFLSVIVLSGIGIPPSFIVLAFMISELVASFSLKKAGFPVLYKGKALFADMRLMFHEGGKRLFVGDTIKFVLFADFLVLGLFVTSSDLGLYAEATVLGRLFLLIPLSLRPIISQRLLQVAQRDGQEAMSGKLNTYVMFSFLFHSIAALVVALHFREAIGFFFGEYGKRLPLGAFLVLLPGLLAYSTLIMAEVAYDVSEKVPLLRGVVIKILVLNFALNLYLVPFSGIYGAATATSLTFFVYLLYFGKGIHKRLSAFKAPIITAGFSAYLLYSFLRWAETGLMADIILVPVGVMVMYWLSGYFAGMDKMSSKAEEIELMENGGVNE